jgi:DNA topoisomerase-1
MPKILVIVESPAKVKTINKILGIKYKVTASMGHLIDLPKSTIGVDVDHDFEAKFIVVRDKHENHGQIKKEAKDVDEIYIATDPDREGEAIGWNLVQHIAKDKKVSRVVFHEITKDAVKKAFANPVNLIINLWMPKMPAGFRPYCGLSDQSFIMEKSRVSS